MKPNITVASSNPNLSMHYIINKFCLYQVNVITDNHRAKYQWKYFLYNSICEITISLKGFHKNVIYGMQIWQEIMNHVSKWKASLTDLWLSWFMNMIKCTHVCLFLIRWIKSGQFVVFLAVHATRFWHILNF